MKKRVNILLVDDRPAKLLTYELMLAELGEHLIKARSGKQALEQLWKHDIAVVLTNVSMPGMDGFELADAIRQHPRFQRTAIIFVSAVRLSDQDRLKGYEHGAVDYVSVPIVPEVLCAKVRIFVDLHRKTQQLSDSEKSLRRLSGHLLRSQDEERRSIGRDLQDSLSQNLALIKIGLDSVLSSPTLVDGEAGQHLGECRRLTEEAIKESLTICYLMYPLVLDDLGLRAAIEWYLGGFAQRSKISTAFDVSPDFGRLPPDAELAMFRVLQESLTNVHRHSGSPTACVRLFIQDGIACLEVIDQGKGIPAGILEGSSQDNMRSSGVGLRSIDERVRQLGGTLEISSSSSGTAIVARIPVGHAPRRALASGAS